MSERGSEKLYAAWRARTLSEESVKQIAATLEDSTGTVRNVQFHGGREATGVSVSMSYRGDDGEGCGNDIIQWFKWHHDNGGVGILTAPGILINGTPWIEEILVDLSFGETTPTVANTQVAGGPAGATR